MLVNHKATESFEESLALLLAVGRMGGEFDETIVDGAAGALAGYANSFGGELLKGLAVQLFPFCGHIRCQSIPVEMRGGASARACGTRGIYDMSATCM